jgi:ribosomal-protein-alanine N-acetyltransferase
MALWGQRSAIEEARAGDAAAMAEIHERSFHRPWSTEDMTALLSDYPVVQGLVAKRGAKGRSRIAGFVLVRTAGGEAEILTVAVDPSSRRRGLGRKLIEEAARRAYRDRADAVFLEVDESNRAAVSLYRSLGFETVGQRSRYYDKPDAPPGTALVMRLPLKTPG